MSTLPQFTDEHARHLMKYPHSVQDRQRELIELAKALRAEGREGSLVKTISEFTTFSEQYVRILPDEYKQEYTTPEKSELSSDIEQKSKRKPREQTSEEEKLKTLYDKLEKSVFTGQGKISQYIEKAKNLGLNVENYEVSCLSPLASFEARVLLGANMNGLSTKHPQQLATLWQVHRE